MPVGAGPALDAFEELALRRQRARLQVASCRPKAPAHISPDADQFSVGGSGLVRVVTDVRHNLPVQPTRFIGRERELAEVKQLLLCERLVTLTGAAGIGKTRLELRLTAALAH